MKNDQQNLIDAMEERILLGFLKDLRNLVFVKSTDSITGEVEDLDSIIEDMGAIIRISSEFDREDLKNLLVSRTG